MKGDQRKKEILKTAAQLFRKKGYNAISMRDLAQALGIKAASLYNHIKSKQEILSLIVMEVAESFTLGIDSISKSKISSIQKLNQIIELHVNITIEHADAISSVNNDWMHLKEPDLDSFIKMRDGYEDKLRKIIKKGIKDKEIADINIEVMLFSMLSTLRTLHLWYSKKQGINKEELCGQMKHILLKGISLDK